MSKPPNFDRLASFYRWMELVSFGPFLWWCRCAFLPEVLACRRALILGDGDGRFTARLLQTNPGLQIDAVDASRAMLEALVGRAHRASPDSDSVHTELTDARDWQPKRQSADEPYDLVVTHFFLDCLTTEEVQALALKLRGAVSPSAVWLVSEFAIPAGWYGRLIARPVVSALYWAFGWLTGLSVRTLPDHRHALRHAGFTVQRNRTWLAGLLISELWIPCPSSPLLKSTTGPSYTN